MLQISIEQAMKRARKVQPPDTDIISLNYLPDDQWVAHYITDNPPTKNFKRLCCPFLECPLFDQTEL